LLAAVLRPPSLRVRLKSSRAGRRQWGDIVSYGGLEGIRRDIVAIGASAGGLKALSEVISRFPASLPACVLIVQHLDPRYESHLADILSRRGPLPVVQAAEGDAVRKGRILVAPAGYHMLVENDQIKLATTELVHFVRPSVDLLFESAAAAYGKRVVGVILTGGGVDGALGIRAVKERGGLTIAQDPTSAESTGMPSSAISTGDVDLVLPLDEIGAAIAKTVFGEEVSAGH
jgi:two-component system, chemotaxis family, protein-glutamate methylesterase/glutaminase